MKFLPLGRKASGTCTASLSSFDIPRAFASVKIVLQSFTSLLFLLAATFFKKPSLSKTECVFF